MPSNYEAIRAENTVGYGTKVENYGKLLAERLYSDRTHFVFELLQNAEDVGAGAVHFDLHADRLEVRHDGHPFTEANVRAICGLADGTKSEDLTKIGTFGIGFKSVYGYTTAPRIHSREEHFQIRHYVHPHAVAPVPALEDETLFVFPFDREDLYPGEAFEQILARLVGLGASTLLFLNHIRTITWRTEQGSEGRLEREFLAGGWPARVRVREHVAGSAETATYLVFDRPVRHEGGTSMKVELAFRLATSPEGADMIMPVTDARLAVFFPTEKPTFTGFLLQGPYRTTPARDNVPPHDAWNRYLVDETALLLGSAFPRLKELGLLTPSFLTTLPLSGAPFTSDAMFQPLYRQVKQVLLEGEYLPADGGGFVSVAHGRLTSSSGVRGLLSSPQLGKLLGDPGIRWVDERISRFALADVWTYLHTVLGMPDLGPAALGSSLTGGFIAEQEDAWVCRLYGFLGQNEPLWRARALLSTPLASVPYLRLEDGTHVLPPAIGEEATVFLPPAEETEFPVIRRVIARHPDAQAFLVRLGLREPSQVEEIKHKVLARYQPAALEAVTPERHAQDVRKVASALAQLAPNDRFRLRAELMKIPFFAARNQGTGEVVLKMAREIYRPSAELACYFQGNPEAWFLAEGPEIEPIAVLCTVATEVQRISLELGPGGSYGRDYELEGLAFFLDRLATLDASEAMVCAASLWSSLRALLLKDEEFFVARVKPPGRRRTPLPREARFVQRLKESAWLPSPGGELVPPGQISPSELPSCFRPSPQLQDKLGLRPDAAAELAASLGTSVELIDEYLRHQQEFLAWRKQQPKKELPPEEAELTRTVPPAATPAAEPGSPEPRAAQPRAMGPAALPSSLAPDPARRAQKAAEKAESAEPKQYAPVVINRRVSGASIDKRTYLRSHHTNIDGEVICQLCDGRMPFKLNGEDYFEAPQFIDTHGVEQEANHLALCPNCAAEYRFCCLTSADERIRRLLALDSSGPEEDLRLSLELPVHRHPRFTQKHLIDLQETVRLRVLELEGTPVPPA